MYDYTVIDQHFVAFDESFIGNYNKNQNKTNPNIMMGKIFYRGSSNTGQYTEKYPFGTTHFIIAVLEYLEIMRDTLPIEKSIGNFDLADLIFRADRVIGNTCEYTDNCRNWADWLMYIGGENTRRLFTIAKNDYRERKAKESLVENKLRSLGCEKVDGECSNLFLDNHIQRIRTYFEFLSNAMDLPRNLVPDNAESARFGRLSGTRMNMTPEVKAEVLKENVFSYAIVNMGEVSITYME